MGYRLYTDTDSDITLEEAKEWGYELISMPYAVDGKQVYPYVDFEVFDYHEYYDMLRSGVLPTTSALNAAEYLEIIEPVFAAGDDMIYVHLSSAMTASINFLKDALNQLKEKYPERRCELIDTKGITLGEYCIVREIGLLHKNGASMDEILEWAKKEGNNFYCWFFADDLKFFRRSGRVSGFAALMGGLIGIKPIIYMNKQGVMEGIDKVRGRGPAIKYLADKVCELGTDLENHTIILGHTDALELAEELKKELQSRLGDKVEFKFVAANPTAGAHCGPNAVGVGFHTNSK